MTAGSDALAGAYAKLDRAEQLHQKMHDVFECLVREDEPYTMQFESLNKPAGMVIARFKIDKPIPHAMSVIAGESSQRPRRNRPHLGAPQGPLRRCRASGLIPICSTADRAAALIDAHPDDARDQNADSSMN